VDAFSFYSFYRAFSLDTKKEPHQWKVITFTSVLFTKFLLDYLGLQHGFLLVVSCSTFTVVQIFSSQFVYICVNHVHKVLHFRTWNILPDLVVEYKYHHELDILLPVCTYVWLFKIFLVVYCMIVGFCAQV